MRTRIALNLPLAVIAIFGIAALVPARAQTVPEGQSCGGILCDMGVFGHKTAPLAPPAPSSAAVPLPSPAAPVAQQRVETPAAATEEPARPKPRKPKRVAKIAQKPRATTTPEAAGAPVRRATPAAAAASPPDAASRDAPPVASSPTAAPQRPPFMFQPIYR